MSTPADETLFRELVASAIEAHDRDGFANYEKICGTRWDLIDSVRETVELTHELQGRRDNGADDPQVGRRLDDRYRIVRRLGAGAMGVVYAAHDEDLDRPVAIKLLRAAILGRDEAQSRFRREAEAMAAVQHDCIASVFARGTTAEGDSYLATELLEGLPLNSVLEIAETRREQQRGDDTTWIAAALGPSAELDRSFVRQAVRWIERLAGGLQVAHDAGVIHRDIKPSNVFVRSDGTPVLLDFGIASREQHPTITRDGGALGTPAYMAPESLDPNANAGRPVDVYGLCATLYHLLTLRAPYRGTPSQVMSALPRKDPSPAARLRPGLPRDLQAVLEKGMARNPKGRYESASALADDLRAFLDYRPVTARPIGPLLRTARRLRRSRPFWSAAVVLVLAVGSLGAWHAHADWQRARRGAWLSDSWRYLPANTTLNDFANRRVTRTDEREAIEAILDKAVADRFEPLPALAYRAAFRLDQGDVAGCQRDMDRAAAEIATPFARAVAERFRRLAPDAADARAVDLDDLPPPTTADDTLLAAYLRYRVREREAAATLLADPRLATSPTAEDMRILLASNALGKIGNAQDRIAPAQQLSERIAQHEQRLGLATAQTLHVKTFALLMQRLYGRCLEAAQQGVALTPWSYSMRLNGGQAARRVNRPELAIDMLQEAIELRPQYWKPRRTVFLALMDMGELDRAEAVLDSDAFRGSPALDYYRLTMRGQLESERALRLHAAKDLAAAQAAARIADDSYLAASRIRKVSDRFHWAASKAVLAGDIGTIFRLLADSMHGDPLNWAQIEQLAAWLPDPITPADRDAIRTYLEVLSAYVSRQSTH